MNFPKLKETSISKIMASFSGVIMVGTYSYVSISNNALAEISTPFIALIAGLFGVDLAHKFIKDRNGKQSSTESTEGESNDRLK